MVVCVLDKTIEEYEFGNGDQILTELAFAQENIALLKGGLKENRREQNYSFKDGFRVTKDKLRSLKREAEQEGVRLSFLQVLQYICYQWLEDRDIEYTKGLVVLSKKKTGDFDWMYEGSLYTK